MLKPTFGHILIYFLLKYVLFYLFIAIRNSNYSILEISTLTSGEDWFYFLWVILFLPVVSMLVLSGPLFYAFRSTRAVVFTSAIATLSVIEYLGYTYLASQADLINGLILVLGGLLLLFFMFQSSIRNIYST